MQFPKELQLGNLDAEEPVLLTASMKCSSRRNCNRSFKRGAKRVGSLNEVQFPKELQLDPVGEAPARGQASMKCSSRRNCNTSRSPLWTRTGRPQ